MSSFAGAKPLLSTDRVETTAETRKREFAAMVIEHSRFLYRVVYAVLRHAQDAEDTVQETFLKLYRNQSWQRATNRKAFLARTAWRLALDTRRTRGSEAHEDVSALEPASSAPSPERQVLDAHTHAAVHQLIDALPEKLRYPLVLSSLEELTSAEVGEIMGIPEGTVRTRVMRARQLLKEKLLARKEVRRGR